MGFFLMKLSMMTILLSFSIQKQWRRFISFRVTLPCEREKKGRTPSALPLMMMFVLMPNTGVYTREYTRNSLEEPSFVDMNETPPGKHIPAWLPALPDPHTYVHTPMWNERTVHPRAEKIEQARWTRKAERALLSLQQRLLRNGSAGTSSQARENHVKEVE